MEANQQQPPPASDTKPCIFTSTTATSTTYPTTSLSSQPASYLHLLQQQQQQLQLFWSQQRQEIEQVNDFKNHQLPLARIKKIMKADEDVRMISAEAPILFAKACELFILELTIRSWLHAEENKRRTLQKNDIAAAITRTYMFDFLVDIVPREEIKDDASGLVGGIMTGAPSPGVGGVSVGIGGAGASSTGGMPYYYPPVAPTAVMIGRSGMDPTLPPPVGMYAPQPSQTWQSVWQPAEDGGYGSEITGVSAGTGGESQQDDIDEKKPFNPLTHDH